MYHSNNACELAFILTIAWGNFKNAENDKRDLVYTLLRSKRKDKIQWHGVIH